MLTLLGGLQQGREWVLGASWRHAPNDRLVFGAQNGFVSRIHHIPVDGLHKRV